MSMMSVFPGGGTGGGEPGPAGVGIESIEQTTTSTESGGENVVTVTRTDGQTAGTFSVFNGAQGEQGPAGRDGYLVHNAQVYSTEETVVGQWIDGKPIYRRTYVGTFPSSAYMDVDFVAIIDIDALVSIEGVGNNTYSIPSAHPVNGTVVQDVLAYSNSMWKAENSNIMRMRVGPKYVSHPFFVHISYTKTTDEATIAIATVAELDAAYSEGVQAA